MKYSYEGKYIEEARNLTYISIIFIIISCIFFFIGLIFGHPEVILVVITYPIVVKVFRKPPIICTISIEINKTSIDVIYKSKEANIKIERKYTFDSTYIRRVYWYTKDKELCICGNPGIYEKKLEDKVFKQIGKKSKRICIKYPYDIAQISFLSRQKIITR